MKHVITTILLLLYSLPSWSTELSIDTSTTIKGSFKSPIQQGISTTYGCKAPGWPEGVTGTVTVTGFYNDELMDGGDATCNIHDTGGDCIVYGFVYGVNNVQCSYELHNTGNWEAAEAWISTFMDTSKKATSGKVKVPALHVAKATVPDTVDFGNLIVGGTATATRDVTFSVTGGDPADVELELTGDGTEGGGKYEAVTMKTVGGEDAGVVTVIGTKGNTHIEYGGALYVTGNETLLFQYTPDKAYGQVTGTLAATLKVP